MIQNVIFDLGGVLIDWNPRYLYRQLLPDEEQVEAFLSTVCTMDWNEEQDGGRPFEEGIAILSQKWPQHQSLIEAYYHRWIEMIGGAIYESVDVLKALQEKGVPLYALTNWSAQTFPLIQDDFPFLNWFKGIVVSGEEKVKKPDPAIYQLILNRYELEPTKTLFIDDNKRNIDAADAMGIKTHHFTSSAAMAEALAALELVE